MYLIQLQIASLYKQRAIIILSSAMKNVLLSISCSLLYKSKKGRNLAIYSMPKQDRVLDPHAFFR